jgi:NAD kinase
VPRIGLIVNDGKPLAVQTADTIQQRLEAVGHAVERASSSGGMVGFANPDQHLRLRGYSACVPKGFDQSMVLAIVLGGDGTVLSAARQTAPWGFRFSRSTPVIWDSWLRPISMIWTGPSMWCSPSNGRSRNAATSW